MSPKISSLVEIGLRVKDLATMAAFYQDVLGFQVEIAASTHIFLKIGELSSPLGEIGHPQMLVLFDRDMTPDIHVSTLDHLAFEIPAADYDKELAKFQKQGVVLRERSWPDSLDWQARSFFFRDPEGNIIELIAAQEHA